MKIYTFISITLLFLLFFGLIIARELGVSTVMGNTLTIDIIASIVVANVLVLGSILFYKHLN